MVTGSGTVQRHTVTQSSMRPMSHPTVATQPTSQSVMAGQNAAFAAAASGLPGPKVQWQVSTDHGVTFFPVTGSDERHPEHPGYHVRRERQRVRGGVRRHIAGSATTNPATLTVIPPVAPTITTQPSNQTVNPRPRWQLCPRWLVLTPRPRGRGRSPTDGGTTWSNLLSHRPRRNSTTLSGPVYATFENGLEYRAVFTNGAGLGHDQPGHSYRHPAVSPRRSPPSRAIRPSILAGIAELYHGG